jgi:hypothetical protein
VCAQRPASAPAGLKPQHRQPLHRQLPANILHAAQLADVQDALQAVQARSILRQRKDCIN